MTTLSSTMSSAELLLVNALRLTKDGRAPFSAETLIVSAWLGRPDKFGMREHRHPDSHRSMVYLCGAKGLVGRGCLSRSTAGYSLTDDGRRLAMRLAGESVTAKEGFQGEQECQNGKPVPFPVKGGGDSPGRLPSQHDDLLRQLFAVRRRDRPIGEWTFRDACAWWRLLGDDYTPDQVDWMSRQLTEIAALLAGQRCVLSDGRETTANEIAGLIELDGKLRRRFASHLKVLANRNGKAHA